MLHFETIIISRDQNRHAVLKRQFENFINDLKTIVDNFILMLMNEYQNYLIKINEARIKLFMNFRKSIFQHIIAHVTSIVMKKIMFQYKLLIDLSTAFFFARKHLFLQTSYHAVTKFKNDCLQEKTYN